MAIATIVFQLRVVNVGIEGKPARDFRTQLHLADWLPDHEGARRADVDGIEMPQLFREF